MNAVATNPTPASTISATEQGPHTAHQNAALNAYRRVAGTRTHAKNTSDPKSRNVKTIAANRRGSTSRFLFGTSDWSISKFTQSLVFDKFTLELAHNRFYGMLIAQAAVLLPRPRSMQVCRVHKTNAAYASTPNVCQCFLEIALLTVEGGVI